MPTEGDASVPSPTEKSSAFCGRVTIKSGSEPSPTSPSDGTSRLIVPSLSCETSAVPTPRHMPPEVTRWWPARSSVVSDMPIARSSAGSGMPTNSAAGRSVKVPRVEAGRLAGGPAKFGAGIGGTQKAGSLISSGVRVAGF